MHVAPTKPSKFIKWRGKNEKDSNQFEINSVGAHCNAAELGDTLIRKKLLVSIQLDVSLFFLFFFVTFFCYEERCRRLSVTKRSILIFIFHLKSLSVCYVETHKTKNLTSNNVSLMCFSSVFSMMDSQSNYLWHPYEP